nr:unnamed protein product [Callosobruchus chinensis]
MLATRTTKKYYLEQHLLKYPDLQKDLFHVCIIKSVFTDHFLIERKMSSAISNANIQALVKIDKIFKLTIYFLKNKAFLCHEHQLLWSLASKTALLIRIDVEQVTLFDQN